MGGHPLFPKEHSWPTEADARNNRWQAPAQLSLLSTLQNYWMLGTVNVASLIWRRSPAALARPM